MKKFYQGLCGPLLLLLASCGGVVPDAPKGGGSSVTSPSLSQCLSFLDQRGVKYRRLPDERKSGKCRIYGAVQLLDYGMPTKNITAMTCQLADPFTLWVRNDVSRAAQKHFGAGLIEVETFGSYSCRNIAGTGKISEHGLANAVDVSAFRLSNGRRITVLGGWNGSNGEHAFLRDIAQNACARFGTVLGPSYNKAHQDHLHLDMALRKNGNYCR